MVGNSFQRKNKIGDNMVYYKRKDGSVFGKINPSKEQDAAYKKDGCVICDENGKAVKKKPAKKDK